MPVDPAVSRTALLAGALTPALQATAHALADAGFAVAAPSVEPRAHGIGPAGVLVINTVAADRADPDGADAIGADANGAGLGGAGDWREAAEPAARAFRLVERFAAQLGEGTRGVVVFILDQRSLPADASAIPAAVARAALAELTPRLALALAPRVRVNAVALGSGLSSARQTPILSTKPAGVPPPAAIDPEDVARAVTAMLGLSAMTGQILTLDGSRHVQVAPSATVAGVSAK